MRHGCLEQTLQADAGREVSGDIVCSCSLCGIAGSQELLHAGGDAGWVNQ